MKNLCKTRYTRNGLRQHSLHVHVRMGLYFPKTWKRYLFDGHERPDVVQYHKEWALRMLGYKLLMAQFGDDEQVIEPILQDPSQKKLMLVTLDECTFYANDGKQDMWMLDGEIPLRKRGQGARFLNHG